jgi:hypothetical protein
MLIHVVGCAMSQVIGCFLGIGTGFFLRVPWFYPISIIQLVLHVDPLICHQHHIISAVDCVVKKHT